MSLDQLVGVGDKNKLRVISGDIEAGYWSLEGFRLVRSTSCCIVGAPFQVLGRTKAVTDAVQLEGNIAGLVVEQDSGNRAGSVLGAGVGAVAGFRYFGFPGAVAGAVVGQVIAGGSEQVKVLVKLMDGRTFSASVKTSIYKRLTAIANRA